jgi:type II secretory pathway component PulC
MGAMGLASASLKRRVSFSVVLFSLTFLPFLATAAGSPPALRLAGIILGPRPTDAQVVVEDLNTGEQFFRVVGQKVGDAVILGIEERKVLLKRGDQVTAWLISQGLASEPATESGPDEETAELNDPDPMGSTESVPVEKTAELKQPDPMGSPPANRVNISQLYDPEEIQKVLYPPLPPETEVTRQPVSQDSVRDLRQDLRDLFVDKRLAMADHPTMGKGLMADQSTVRAFQGLGLQEGDLILKINGIVLASPDRMADVDDVLSRANIINLVAVRGDDLISVHLAVQ